MPLLSLITRLSSGAFRPSSFNELILGCYYGLVFNTTCCRHICNALIENCTANNGLSCSTERSYNTSPYVHKHMIVQTDVLSNIW